MTENREFGGANLPLRELKANQRVVLRAMLSVFVSACVYAYFTGLTVFMGDTFLLANRAKHFAGEFNLHLSRSLAPMIDPPLDSVLLSVA